MKKILTALQNFFASSAKKTGKEHTPADSHTKKVREATAYVEKHFGRALTRLSER